MIPLGLTSVLLWALIIDRLLVFRAKTKDDISLTGALAALEGGTEPIAGKGMRAQLVGDFLAGRSGSPDIDREVLKECGMRQRWDLTRFLALIAVLASAAPLLGLLGTVLGMIETFDVIAIFGTGNARALAGGISVALVTTQTGLLIAIPGLFFSGLLMRRSRNLSTQLDETITVLDRNLMLKTKALQRGADEVEAQAEETEPDRRESHAVPPRSPSPSYIRSQPLAASRAYSVRAAFSPRKSGG